MLDLLCISFSIDSALILGPDGRNSRRSHLKASGITLLVINIPLEHRNLRINKLQANVTYIHDILVGKACERQQLQRI